MVKYDDNSPVFLFTNENVQEYIAKSGGAKNKNVLTVASSGDHAFEALLAGAKHVDTFDINILQKAVIDLKTKMIRYLDYNKFMDFFFSKRMQFKLELLSNIEQNITPAEIMLLLDLKSGNFRVFEPERTIENTSYLHSNNKYQDLQSKLPYKFDFKHVDIRYLPHTLNQKYDIIMLSNIYESMPTNKNNDIDAMTDYYNYILNPLSQNLNNKGTIFMDYMWIPDNTPTDLFLNFWKSFLIAMNQKIQKHHKMDISTVKSNITGTPIDLVMHMQQKSR